MTPLSAVKDFLRIYDSHNDAIIEELTKAAMWMVEEVTGYEYQGDPLEDMCIKLLVRHWFDNETEDVPFGVRSLLTQLKYRTIR